MHVRGKERFLLALISMYRPPVDAVWPAVGWPVSQSGNRPVTAKQCWCINCQSHLKARTRDLNIHVCVCSSAMSFRTHMYTYTRAGNNCDACEEEVQNSLILSGAKD